MVANQPQLREKISKLKYLRNQEAIAFARRKISQNGPTGINLLKTTNTPTRRPKNCVPKAYPRAPQSARISQPLHVRF